MLIQLGLRLLRANVWLQEKGNGQVGLRLAKQHESESPRIKLLHSIGRSCSKLTERRTTAGPTSMLGANTQHTLMDSVSHMSNFLNEEADYIILIHPVAADCIHPEADSKDAPCVYEYLYINN